MDVFAQSIRRKDAMHDYRSPVGVDDDLFAVLDSRVPFRLGHTRQSQEEDKQEERTEFHW
jgi:hypothetical protein